ncbi:MAG: sirohydrochlorin chelatase [Bacteroidota bacterium]
MKSYRAITLAIIAVLLSWNISIAQPKLGLLIIAHGSPSQQWNVSVLELMDQVKQVLSERGENPFSDVRVAFMEFAQPSIDSVVRDFERNGIQNVYALPIFIAPSAHTLFELPAILGAYYDPEVVQRLAKEGIIIVRTNLHITLGPTLNKGDALNEVMLDRVRELSTSPDSEGVIILAHGDNQFKPLWCTTLRRVSSYIAARTGIRYVDFAFVEMGQALITEGAPVILHMAQKTRRTIVVGLYLSSGIGDMAKNVSLNIGSMKVESKRLFAGKNIVFATRGLLPDQRIVKWIANTAIEWSRQWK